MYHTIMISISQSFACFVPLQLNNTFDPWQRPYTSEEK